MATTFVADYRDILPSNLIPGPALDPWRDTAEILALFEPDGGWSGPTREELAAWRRSLARTEIRADGCVLSTLSPRASTSVRARSGGTDHRQVRVGARKVYIHNLSFAVAWGLSLAELAATTLHIAHSCDVPRCVNAEHLGLTTVAGNNADKHAKSRDAAGEGHGNAVLTEDLAHEVHRLSDIGLTPERIADNVGAAPRTVRNVLSGRTWPRVFEEVRGYFPADAVEAARAASRASRARAYDRKVAATYGVAEDIPGEPFACIVGPEVTA